MKLVTFHHEENHNHVQNVQESFAGLMFVSFVILACKHSTL